MTIIFSPDSLRANVEAATGGHVTVLYDVNGYPSYFVVVPKFNIEDVLTGHGTGVYPAFVVNGNEVSEIFYGQYQAIVKNGCAVSLPGQDPGTSMTFDQALGYCSAKGPGYHLATNAEWMAVALWCLKNGFMPRGNTNYGRDVTNTWEQGVRQDGVTPGTASGTARTLTGSGPAAWRHDGTFAGISDLCGNINEWVGGMRLNAGEIQVLADNNAADNTKDQTATSAEWKAIAAADGSLVAPGTAGTLKYDSVNAGTTGNVGAAVLNNVINNSNDPGGGTDDGYTAAAFEALTADAGITVPDIVYQLGIFPPAADCGGDQINIRNYGERLPLRGGGWNNGADAGVFYLYLHGLRSNGNNSIGFRPAFVNI